MKASAGKRSVETSAFIAFMKLIADSRWVSKRAFQLWLTDTKWRNEVIRRMQDDGYVTCVSLNEKVREKRRKEREKKKMAGEDMQAFKEEIPNYIYGLRYALTKKGREYLGTFNSNRYALVNDLALTPYEYDERKMYRLSMLSEMRAMTELAGFSIHAHAKPYITVLSGLPISTADRPAFSAFTVTKIPDRFIGFENSVFNTGMFQYYAKHKRTHCGYEVRDIKEYQIRETPIGCVYTLPELQVLAEMETVYLGANKDELDKMRYTRLSGVYFSGNGPYRIYNTERTAMKLRKNGEDAMKSYVNSWAGTVYKRSLTIVRDDGYGNPVEEPIEPKVRGSILFGDETHQAAVSVIRHTIRNEIGFGKETQSGKASQNFNLRIVPDTYYLPVIQEAVPLYALMAFPHWPMYIKELGKNFLRELHVKGEAPGIKQEYIGEDAVDGELDDGSTMVTLVSLHLDTVRWMISELSMAGNPFTVVAMEWQKPFFDKLFEEIHPDDIEKIEIIYVPQRKLEAYVKELHEREAVPYRM